MVWSWFISLSPEYPLVTEYSLGYPGIRTHLTRIMGSFLSHRLTLLFKAALSFSKSKSMVFGLNELDEENEDICEDEDQEMAGDHERT